MKFNDRELIKLAEKKPDIEGVLHHMRPQNNDWSDWYQQPSFKERYFKLVANLLFYYRVNEQEPLGVLVLENAQVAYERPHKGIPFAFSLTFKVNDRLRDNSEDKHIFSCRCDDDVSKWVSALKAHSYEYLRSQFLILNTRISMKTGEDPVLNYMRSKYVNGRDNNFTGNEPAQAASNKHKELKRKSTFHSHVEGSTFFETSYNSSRQTKVDSQSTDIVDNLIDL